MKAVVFHGIGDIRIDTVPDPDVTETTDAVVRLTASAICGTDLHMVRGTLGGMKPGTILGHEGVGIVETVGPPRTSGGQNAPGGDPTGDRGPQPARQDRREIGTRQRAARRSADLARAARSRTCDALARQGLSVSEVARRFGTSRQTVMRIRASFALAAAEG